AAQPALPPLIEPEEDAVFAEEEEAEVEAAPEGEATEGGHGTVESAPEDEDDEIEEFGEASADGESRGEARDGDGGRRGRRARRRRGGRGEGREGREGGAPREGGFTHESAPEPAGAHDEGEEGHALEAGE